MPNHDLPKQLFDDQELQKAVASYQSGNKYDALPLVQALQNYIKRIDPTLDTYDPSRQLIAAFSMRNADFLEDSWENWLSVMQIHNIQPH